MLDTLTSDLKDATDVENADRAAAKEAIAEATAIHEKEAATFAKVSSDFKINIAAMTRQLQHWKSDVSVLNGLSVVITECAQCGQEAGGSCMHYVTPLRCIVSS